MHSSWHCVKTPTLPFPFVHCHGYRFNRSTGLLGMSYAQFKPEQLKRGGGTLLKILHMLGLVAMETGVGENKDEVRVNNLTVINFVLKFVGPQREDTLTAIMLAIQVRSIHSHYTMYPLLSLSLFLSTHSYTQVFFTIVAFSIRYGLVRFFYDVVH